MIDTNFKRIKYTDTITNLNSKTIYIIDNAGNVDIKEYKILGKKKELIRKEIKYADPNYFDTFFEVISNILNSEEKNIKKDEHSIKLEIEYDDKTKNIKINENYFYGRDSIDQIFWRLMRTADTVFMD